MRYNITSLTSKVVGHEGECSPVWVNKNQVCHRLDGGVTGFFRLVNAFGFQTGPEFHGIIKNGSKEVVGVPVDPLYVTG